MSDFNSIWVQIVTLKLSLISDPVSGDFAQIFSGLRRRKKSEKWQAYLQGHGNLVVAEKAWLAE